MYKRMEVGKAMEKVSQVNNKEQKNWPKPTKEPLTFQKNMEKQLFKKTHGGKSANKL
jgi:hypothetical protein